MLTGVLCSALTASAQSAGTRGGPERSTRPQTDGPDLHPAVREGRKRYEQADLEGALQSFERALRSGELSRRDLKAVYEGRVLVHLAQMRRPAIQKQLQNLALIDPEHEFGPEVPPDVVREFRRTVERLPGPIALQVHTEAVPGQVTLRPKVRHDRASLVKRTEVRARTKGGQWRRAVEGPLSMPVLSEGVVQYYAVAVGPGGARLAHVGTREQPRETRVAAPRTSSAGTDSGGARRPWLYGGLAAGAAAVAAAVVVGVLVSQDDGGSDRTQPSYPSVRF
jgi:hypothetical protein